jgi:hypothetical protein
MQLRSVGGTVRRMMSREEFERTVRAMRAEGVPLSMPNLMLRTELPRHVIEEWLEAMAEAERRTPSAKAAPDAQPPSGDPTDELLRKVHRLKDEVIGDAARSAVKERLGLGRGKEPTPVHGTTKRPRKDLRIGAGLGLVGGPLGLFYAAPYSVAITASTVYLAALVGLHFVPVVGTMLVAYLLPIVHLTSAVAGAGYTWRYNRTGRRTALLPKHLA